MQSSLQALWSKIVEHVRGSKSHAQKGTRSPLDEELAFVSGPSEPVLLEQTISEKFASVCRDFPDRIAIKTPASNLSYSELNKQSDGLALGLLSFGIKLGDRVAISLGNCAPYAVIAYACFKIGAVVVPLNPAYTPEQVVSALRHISAACFIVSTEITLPYKEPKSTSSLLAAVIGNGRDGISSIVLSLRNVMLVDNSSGRANTSEFGPASDYNHLVFSNADKKLPAQSNMSNSDIATIQFTSGTTSVPKAACLSHKNVLNNGFLVGQGMQLAEQDIICCPPPLYHCFGLVLGLLASMTYGACLVMPSEAFDAREVLRSLQEDRPTALYGVPTMFIAVLELVAQNGLTPKEFSQLRTGIIGGSPIPSALRQTLHETLNLSDLASCYGLTESSPIICMTRSNHTVDQKLHTVGQMLPHTSLRIVSRDDPMKTLRRGEKGELLISGYCVMKDYWKDEKRTSEALIAEFAIGEERTWLRSGDEAMVDNDGFVRITGRIKDIIIRGGENIYPPGIENVLLQHPMVLNASVVGLPDERYGEVIGAFVIAKEGMAEEGKLTEDEVQKWVRDRLSKMMVPKYVFFIERFTLTASGKIEKYKLRDIGIQKLRHSRRLGHSESLKHQ